MMDYTMTHNPPWYSNRTIQTVVFSKNITSLGKYAFYNCINLQNLTIPPKVTIIPESLLEGYTSFGKFAFRECRNLLYLIYPLKATIITDSLFYGCTKISSIDVHH